MNQTSTAPVGYAVIDAAGRIVKSGHVPASDLAAQAHGAGTRVVPLDAAVHIDPLSQRIDLSVTDDFGNIVPRVVDYRPAAPAADAWRTWSWSDTARRHLPVPTLAALKRDRSAPLIGAIAALEEGQSRALRDIKLAELALSLPPPAAVARLRSVDADIRPLRAKLQAIAGAADEAALADIA